MKQRLELVRSPQTEAIQHVLEHLRELSAYAKKHGLGSIQTFLEASILEAEFKLTGELPSWRSRPYPRRRR